MGQDYKEKAPSLESQVDALKECIVSGVGESSIQTDLYVKIVSTDSPKTWRDQCLYLFLWGIQNQHFKQSHLDSTRFLILLDCCRYKSQKRVLWDFQLGVVDRFDLEIRTYLRDAVTRVDGPERSYLRKILDSLEGKLISEENSHDVESLRAITRDEYLALDRENKLVWLKKIYELEFPIPGFALELLYLEEDPFVLSGIAKIFPVLLVKKQALTNIEAIDKFRFLSTHSDSRVRANCLEGYIDLFAEVEPPEEVYEIFLVSTRDPDNRVKVHGLKGLQLFSRTQLLPQLEATLNNCTEEEELKSFEWLLFELGLAGDFAIEVNILRDKVRDLRMATSKVSGFINAGKGQNAIPDPKDYERLEEEESKKMDGFRIYSTENEKPPELFPQIQTDKPKIPPQELIKERSFLHRLFVISSIILIPLGLTAIVMRGEIYSYLSSQYYEEGILHLNSKDYEKAMDSLVQAAEYGHVVAQMKLANMNKLGIGSEPDPEKSRHWLELAATQNNPEALATLGELYWQGKYVEKNRETAISYIIRAAEGGHPKSQNNLAMIYLFGDGIPMNRKLGLQWLEIAAGNGYEPAKENLKVFQSTLNDLLIQNQDGKGN